MYGAALFLASVLFLIAATVMMILAQSKGEVLQSFILVVTLLTLPTLFASFYASYRDIFPESAVPAEPPLNAGSP